VLVVLLFFLGRYSLSPRNRLYADGRKSHYGVVETNIMLHATEELRQNTTSPTGIFLWIQNIYNTKDNCTAISMFTDIRALKTKRLIFRAKSSVSEYQMSETIPITDQLVCP